jgi:Cu2+-exporting ATPase
LGFGCAYCGLPLGRRPVAGAVGGVAGHYCCTGCLLAHQVTRARGDSGAAAALLVRLGLALLFAMNVMMVSLPTYVPQVYGASAQTADGPLFLLLRVLAACFAAPVLLLLGWPVLRGAWQGLVGGAANSDALIFLGVCSAYVLSLVNTVEGRSAVYFDTASMLLVLVTLGRYLEARAKADASAAIRENLAPTPALSVRLTAAGREVVRPDDLVPGDTIEVGPGGAFPTDGVVLEGTGGVDEAALTGESRPVVKHPGSSVASGTCSVDGLFRLRVEAPAQASAAARIAALLAAARAERTELERLADGFAMCLTPIVLAIAGLASAVWAVRAGADQAVLVGLAVLVVACPCALGIATPVAVWIGLAAAASKGVVVRSAPVLERVAATKHVLFDKTGTLTERMPRLTGVEPAPDSELSPEELLRLAAALEVGLTHPLARAVVTAAESRGLATAVASAVRAVPGLGVRGLVEGRATVVGSARLVASELGSQVAAREDDGRGEVRALVAGDGRLLGALRFAETLRPSVERAFSGLRTMGVEIGLVSGDVQASVLVPALLSADDAATGLTPEEKVERVRAAKRTPRRGTVLMVGDGINDAPALAAADVGVAVGEATDLARFAADIVILRDDLTLVPWLVAHARGVVRVGRQNLVWAFAYNAVAVALAAAGTLNPLVASLAMIASSLFVVANARRLAPRRVKQAQPPAAAQERPSSEAPASALWPSAGNLLR